MFLKFNIFFYKVYLIIAHGRHIFFALQQLGRGKLDYVNKNDYIGSASRAFILNKKYNIFISKSKDLNKSFM